MIIGICGKSGCGKSTLANRIVKLTNNQAVHLDIDKVGHSVLLIEDVKQELIRAFGISIIEGDKVDRKKLGAIVFDSRSEMAKLTDITWKHMQIEIDKFLDENKDKTVILDWLLLSISKYFEMCDIKILLDIPYEIRKQRAMERDNISEEAFALREKASIDFKKNDFDYILNTDEEKEVESLVKIL